jgi:predicted PurR-regulated permease PerM
MAEVHRDLTRSLLTVIFIVALIGSTIWILRPFIGAAVWAATIVVATWPLMIALQKRLWHKRSLAVALIDGCTPVRSGCAACIGYRHDHFQCR